jgi:hypothetical protein
MEIIMMIDDEHDDDTHILHGSAGWRMADGDGDDETFCYAFDGNHPQPLINASQKSEHTALLESIDGITMRQLPLPSTFHFPCQACLCEAMIVHRFGIVRSVKYPWSTLSTKVGQFQKKRMHCTACESKEMCTECAVLLKSRIMGAEKAAFEFQSERHSPFLLSHFHHLYYLPSTIKTFPTDSFAGWQIAGLYGASTYRMDEMAETYGLECMLRTGSTWTWSTTIMRLRHWITWIPGLGFVRMSGLYHADYPEAAEIFS